MFYDAIRKDWAQSAKWFGECSLYDLVFIPKTNHEDGVFGEISTFCGLKSILSIIKDKPKRSFMDQ